MVSAGLALDTLTMHFLGLEVGLGFSYAPATMWCHDFANGRAFTGCVEAIGRDSGITSPVSLDWIRGEKRSAVRCSRRPSCLSEAIV